MSVTVYTKPDCVQCRATFRALDKAGIKYESIDLMQDVKSFEYVRDFLGFVRAPVVVTPDDTWAGFNPDKINQISNNN